MRVMIWPANDDASAWYRLKFPAMTLAAQGADVVIDSVGPRVQWSRDWSKESDTAPYDARVVGLDTKPDADIVVINRPARAHWAETIPHLQKAGIKVVCDVDDDFASIPIDNGARPTYSPGHVRRCGLRCTRDHARFNRNWIDRACQLADLVTCSTRDLARRYAAHGRVAVLPNLVPESYLAIRPTDRMTETIGWSGSIEVHADDLQAVGTAVRDVVFGHAGWQVSVVGAGNGVAAALQVSQVHASGLVPFGAYPRALARIGVGIVPLATNRFNRSKSALKLAEMSSLGIATVATATPDNKRLNAHGVGVLATTPAQWRAELTKLVTNAGYREDLAAGSREAMATQTYEQWSNLWAEAWESALGRKRVSA